MLSAAGQSEVGVHRLLRFMAFSPDCHSDQDVLLQPAAPGSAMINPHILHIPSHPISHLIDREGLAFVDRWVTQQRGRAALINA